MKIKVNVIGRPINAIGLDHSFQVELDLEKNCSDKDIIIALYSKAETLGGVDNIIRQIRSKLNEGNNQ